MGERWIGELADMAKMLEYVQEILRRDVCSRIHYTFPVGRAPEHVAMNYNFIARITWIFSGELYTTADFDGITARRRLIEGDFLVSDAAGWDKPEVATSNCRALAILFYSSHIRLVFSDFRDGAVVENPYCHSASSAGKACSLLLEALSQIIQEVPIDTAVPYATRDIRAHLLIKTILTQLLSDLSQEKRDMSPQNQQVERMVSFIQHNFHRPINCATVADALRLNRTYASQLFHRVTGRTMKDYLLNLRLEKAVAMLHCHDLQIQTIANECAFDGTSYFIRQFRKRHGISPGAYREEKCR